MIQDTVLTFSRSCQFWTVGILDLRYLRVEPSLCILGSALCVLFAAARASDRVPNYIHRIHLTHACTRRTKYFRTSKALQKQVCGCTRLQNTIDDSRSSTSRGGKLLHNKLLLHAGVSCLYQHDTTRPRENKMVTYNTKFSTWSRVMRSNFQMGLCEEDLMIR